MDRFKKYLLPLLISTLFVSLIIGFRSFLISTIFEPIALMFWAVWRLISSVDQNTYWMFLILICIILVIYLAASGKQRSPRSAYHQINNSLNRIEYWQKLIGEAPSGRSEREYLLGNLRGLNNAINSQVERFNADESVDMVAQEREAMSLSAHRFLYPQTGKNNELSIKKQVDLFSLMPKWIRRWIRKTFYKDNTLVDEILQNLENKLEISNEK